MQKQIKKTPSENNLGQLMRAAKTSIALLDTFYEIMWRLYPDELIAISEESQDMLVSLLIDNFVEMNKP